MTSSALPPLVVDLDGTLIRTDLLHEGAIQLVRHSPLAALRLFGWLRAGKAALKRQVAQHTRVDPELLPYHPEVLAWLRTEHSAGRKLYLCTASHVQLARQVAAHCGIFEDVIATDGVTNLAGARKAAALIDRFGERNFDYAGNARVDLDVWRHARKAIVVDAGESVRARAEALCPVDRVFDSGAARPLAWLRGLRVHQWVKNILLFVPLVAAHDLANAGAVWKLLLAFAAFSLCASAVYVANDLFDLGSDRRHPRKRKRPFAAGDLPVAAGVALVPALTLASLAIALLVDGPFLGWLAAYFGLTWAYTWWLKRVVLLDCLTLALLYTLRVLAGSAAAGLTLSFWLIAFSGFLFLSLAFVKRYAELRLHASAGGEHAHGRGYVIADAPLVQMLGVVSGYTACVVLALYVNSDAILRLYAAPAFVWGTVPVMVWWVSWMWLRAARDEMHDDPLVFALRDPASLAAGLLFAVSLGLGARGLPW